MRADLPYRTSWLLSITKLQNLKAIHNVLITYPTKASFVINHKTTKFESNSQLTSSGEYGAFGCYQSQNYEIWKQFTTCWNLTPDPWTLKVVINHKTTKFESNSQRRIDKAIFIHSCYQSQNYKIWKQFTTQW